MAGAFELPLAAKYAAESGRYEAVVCLGAVIRGETDHYEYVCSEAARGIQDVQLRTGVPCGFGVLTVDSLEQALERVSGGSKRDTGRNAVEATLAALEVKRQLLTAARRRGLSRLSGSVALVIAGLAATVMVVSRSRGRVLPRHRAAGGGALLSKRLEGQSQLAPDD